MNFQSFFRFDRFITPRIIQIVFVIAVIGVVITGIVMMTQGVGGFFLGLFTIAVGVLLARVYAEILMLFFQMHAKLVDIHDALRRSPQS